MTTTPESRRALDESLSRLEAALDPRNHIGIDRDPSPHWRRAPGGAVTLVEMIAAVTADGWKLIALQPDRGGWWAQLSTTDGRGSVVRSSTDAETALRAALDYCIEKHVRAKVSAEDLL